MIFIRLVNELQRIVGLSWIMLDTNKEVYSFIREQGVASSILVITTSKFKGLCLYDITPF
jgi:hypothetical protein